MFKTKVEAKYQIVAIETPDFKESYEYKDYQKFIDEYKLGGDIVKTEDGKFVLAEKVQQDLERSYKLFITYKPAEEYLNSAKEVWANQFWKVIKGIATKMGVEPKGIKVETDFTYDLDSTGSYNESKISVKYNGKTEEWNIAGGHIDMGALIGENAKEWNWVAWLGIEDSPFYTQSWLESYKATENANRIEEFGYYFPESGIRHELIDWLKKQFKKEAA